MHTVKTLRDELDYWQHIGIADDIIKASSMRPEYHHLVQEYKEIENTPKNIENKIKWILMDLENELKNPWYLRPTFWALLKLQIKKWLKR